MQVQSRRQTIAQMAAAVGALILGASVLERILPRRSSPGSRCRRRSYRRDVRPPGETGAAFGETSWLTGR